MQAAKGSKQFLLFRLLKDQATKAGAKLAFQTEHDLTETKDSESTNTKDGILQTTGALETEISATSILAVGDPMTNDLRQALRNDEVVEIWEVDVNENSEEGKYAATYFQGYVTEYSKNPNSDDSVEIELTFAINGLGQFGEVTLTAEQEEVVQYTFTDIQAVPADPEP